LKPSERVKRGLTLVRERHPIFPDSDVYENLKIGGYLRRKDEIKERIEFVMKLFPPLVKLRKRKSGFLSGGEQQMLAIGMALVAKPRLLLMDEPLLGLSPLFQENLAQAMVKIHQEGVTVLVTEQFARPILPIIHRGYVVENGMLTFAGTRQELADNPDVMGGYIGT
jgi:branched-chain amino acid transport system ATP-binding protein